MPRSSLILDTVLDVIFRTALLFSVFLLFAGHNAPGGGFVGGLVGGAALVLRYVAEGTDGVDRILPLPSSRLLGAGLLLAVLTGAGGWIWDDAFLASTELELHAPVLGILKATTALPFDIGVYTVVIGLVLGVLRTLGREGDAEEAA